MFLKEVQRINNKWWIPGAGCEQANIVLLFSHPSFEDLEVKHILGNPKHEFELDQALEFAGLPSNVVWKTYLVKYGIGGKKKPTAEQIEECRPHFEEEMAVIKPKLIITMGAEAFKFAFGHQARFDNWVGQITKGPYGTILPNFSVLNVMLDPMIRLRFKETMELGKRFILDELKYDKWTYEVVIDPVRNTEILTRYIEEGRRHISIDAEWIGKRWNEDEVMVDFQYAMEPNHGIVLSISEDLKTENRPLLDTMKLILERSDARILGWNAKADLKRLRYRDVWPPDEALCFDGMMATAMLNSKHRKGLEHGITHYSNLPPYYTPLFEALLANKLDASEMCKMKLINRDLWNTYCSGDSISHYQVCVNMAAEMKKLPLSVQQYYYNEYLPLTWYLLDMEMKGLPVDTEAMDKMTEQYHKGYAILLERMLTLARECGVEDYNVNYWGSKNELLFKKLKITPGAYANKTKVKSRFWYAVQEEKTQKKFKPTCNSKAMGVMLYDLEHLVAGNPDSPELKKQYEVVKTCHDLGKVMPIIKKFLNKTDTKFEKDYEAPEEDEEEGGGLKSSYWASIGNGNKIFTDFYPCLDNFRCSSTPNMQVAPAKVLPYINKVFGELQIEIPANIRTIFYSGHPDYLLMEADCLAADLAHVSLISQDQKFIDTIHKGNFHIDMARSYFGDNTITKAKDPEKVIQGKTMTFNSTYSSSFKSTAWAIQLDLYSTTGVFFEASFIEKALTNTWNQFPDYMRYKQACEIKAKEYGYIDNAYGMRYDFEPTDDYSTRAGFVNQALAWPVASSMALHMHQVANKLRKMFIKERIWLKYIWPVSYVHDAHYLIFHKDLLKDGWLQNAVYQAFSKDTPIVTGDYVGVDIFVGKCWKDKNPIWEGKTKWDFTDKTWKLKI